MTSQINEKIYNLYIKTVKSFDVFIKGFTETASWTILIEWKNTLVSTLRELASLTLFLIQDGTLVEFSIAKLTESITISILNDIDVVISMSKIMGIESTFVNDILLSFIFGLQSRVSATLDEQTVTTVFTPILALFNALSIWDGDTLSTLDVEILQDLDYTAA